MTDTTTYNFLTFHTILNHPLFQRTRSTILFHYGEGQTLATVQVQDIIQSYFNRGQHNMIVINYDDFATVNTDVNYKNNLIFLKKITLNFYLERKCSRSRHCYFKHQSF